LILGSTGVGLKILVIWMIADILLAAWEISRLHVVENIGQIKKNGFLVKRCHNNICP
jgi:hypothetical protein